MVVSSGPVVVATEKGSPWTAWQEGQPSARNVRRPATASPGGGVNRQRGGVPPARCSASIVIRTERRSGGETLRASSCAPQLASSRPNAARMAYLGIVSTSPAIYGDPRPCLGSGSEARL